jgi:hypothetical protein
VRGREARDRGRPVTCHPRALGLLKTHIVRPAFPTVRALFMLYSPECVEGVFSEVRIGPVSRGIHETSRPSLAKICSNR